LAAMHEQGCREPSINEARVFSGALAARLVAHAGSPPRSGGGQLMQDKNSS